MPDFEITPLDRSAQPPGRHQSATAKRHVLAALASAIIPGSGHLFLDQSHLALPLLVTFVLFLICLFAFRLPATALGLTAVGWGWFGLTLFSGCSAWRSRHEAKAQRLSRWWLVVIVLVASFSTVALFRTGLRVAGFQAFAVNGSAMEPTLERGDRVMADVRCYRDKDPQDQDIVMLRQAGSIFARRVVAGPGESIEGKDGAIRFNGELLPEPYVLHTGSPPRDLETFGPVLIPPGMYFVMGDNRDISRDSRLPDFGMVSRASILGKALYAIRTHPTRVKELH